MWPSPEPGASRPERSGFGSCFFLSYSHTTLPFPNNRPHNYWIQEFYRDLCNELVSIDPRWNADGLPGFMDRSIPRGGVWPHRLAEQLATCRVFVPLYSRAYFDSKFCGMEWAVFRERQMAHVAETGLPNEAVIPVIWQPVPRDELPESVRSVQLATLGDSSLYLERGLFELIRLNREREYLSVVIRLAQLVNDTALNSAPPPGPPIIDLQQDRRLFPEHLPGASAGRRLYITLATHDRTSAPPGRHLHYYGEQPEDWNPYHPESTVPLLSRAEDVARELGFTPLPRPEAADDHSDGPGIMLIDPWVAEDPVRADQILEMDRKRPSWVRALTPCGRGDTQTAERAHELKTRLGLARRWGTDASRNAARDPGTIAEFGQAFSGEVDLAWSIYAKTTLANQAPAGYPSRPRLSFGTASGPATGAAPDSSTDQSSHGGSQ